MALPTTNADGFVSYEQYAVWVAADSHATARIGALIADTLTDTTGELAQLEALVRFEAVLAALPMA